MHGVARAAITVTLSGTLIAVLDAKGEDAAAHAVERISRAASGSFKADRRYEEAGFAAAARRNRRCSGPANLGTPVPPLPIKKPRRGPVNMLNSPRGLARLAAPEAA
jgi:hypothetical protein